MQEQSISRPELDMAVNYLIGHQALDFETSAGIADQFLELMTYDLSLDTWSRLPPALPGLESRAARGAVHQMIPADLGLDWTISKAKADFVGKRSLTRPSGSKSRRQNTRPSPA